MSMEIFEQVLKQKSTKYWRRSRKLALAAAARMRTEEQVTAHGISSSATAAAWLADYAELHVRVRGHHHRSAPGAPGENRDDGDDDHGRPPKTLLPVSAQTAVRREEWLDIKIYFFVPGNLHPGADAAEDADGVLTAGLEASFPRWGFDAGR